MLPKKTQRLDFLPPGRFVGLDTLKLLATNHYVLHIKMLLFSHMLVLNIAIRMQSGRLVSITKLLMQPIVSSRKCPDVRAESSHYQQ